MGALKEPWSLCPGELHRHGGRERSSRGAERSGPAFPQRVRAQSVPGTWGSSRRGMNRKHIGRLLSGLPAVK